MQIEQRLTIPSFIDEILKFLERKFYMRKSPLEGSTQNGKSVRPKKE